MSKSLARRTDPVSSHIAAGMVHQFQGKHLERILSALSFAGQATPAQIGQLTGLTVVQVDRRLPELQRQKRVRVVKSGTSDLVRDGFRVWELV